MYTKVLYVAFFLLTGSVFLSYAHWQAPAGPLVVVEAMQTDNSIPVEQLVNDIFAESVCENISNIQAIGDPLGVGYFENGASSIGIDEGIILSTGQIANAHPPNNSTDLSGDFDDASGDSDLNQMAANNIYDAVGIEFDFVPLDSFVSFRYVFASEEYCEFVGSIYNDVFGFFISGPGINGNFANNAINVALVPGTDEFVSINSVNHITNEQYYIGNELEEDADWCGFDYTNTPYLNDIQYDGFTQNFNAVLKLIPCQTYHIRLVVADVGDNFYDSAIFLEAGSFNIGGTVGVEAVVEDSDDGLLHEGCPNGYFVFERENEATLPFPITVNYLISPESTAEEGLDFLPLPGTVTIPAGASSQSVSVESILDDQAEGVETIQLALDIPCFCYSDTATLLLTDPLPFDFALPDLALCEDSQGTVTPEIEGGFPPFSYQWSNGTSDPVVSLSANDPPVFSLTMTDACGNEAIQSAEIIITDSPSATLQGEAIICEGDTAFLHLDLTGLAPWEITYTIDGIDTFTIDNILQSPFAFPATEAGFYELESVADIACTGTISGNGMVTVHRIGTQVTTTDLLCAGDENGSISIAIIEGEPPYQLQWSTGENDIYQIDNLSSADYQLTISDNRGCTKILDIPLIAPPPIDPPTVDCSKLLDGSFALQTTGGTPPYLYSINGGPLEDITTLERLPADQTYELLVEDANGCRATHSWIPPLAYTEAVSFPPYISISAGQSTVIEPELLIPTELIDNFRWIPEDVLSCNDCINPTILAEDNLTLSLRILDIYGCSSQYEVEIRVLYNSDVYAPTAFSPNGDETNDYFTIFSNPYQTETIKEMRIFDRWGALIFEATDIPTNQPTAGWNGYFNGQPAAVGVYVFYAILEYKDGSEEQIMGHLSLLR